ncbi:secreted protein containing TonB-dependent receptor, beta-barrel [gut metagenome]|uniref:Secreted protein containing TonB-dependent receptor, beta-barrel n=1 Tax=gut metagenome TaxID=749906 RepID=J9GH59_9ZZZZ
MMLFLMGASSGAAYAAANPGVTDVKITQQNGNCTGVVVDAAGETIIGASVVVKGTTNGTITGIDGDFSLSGVNKGDIIQISFVGYQIVEVKWDGTPINVTLKDDTQLLGEVVVTALGLKREEKALGYAVTEVKGDELKAANTVNPVAALQGKVAGVEISNSDGGIFGAAKIQIRGASTMGNNNQPIYVVDGVILDNGVSGNDDLNWGADSNDYGNELKNLNPDDFASVSVLKGAAATALYGSRGLNGAVVITTKSGKSGSGLGISFSQSFGIDHAYKTPDIQTVYGPGAYTGRYDANGDGNIWDLNQFQVNANGEHTLIGAYSQGFGPKYDGSMIETYDGTKTKYSPIKDNMLDMYQLGFNTNTNVAIHGGNDKTTFYSSISYKHAESTTPNNTFERYSFLVKATHKLNDWVDVAASVNFANSTPKNAARNIGENFVNGTWNPLYDADYFRHKYLGDHGGLANAAYGDLYANVPGTSYWFGIDKNEYVQKETVVRPTFEVNVKITDWLKFKADANMNYYYNRGENKQLGTGYANEGGYYGIWQNTKEQTTFGGSFTWNKSISDFYVGGFARFEYYNTSSYGYSVETKDGMVVPGQWFVDNSKSPKVSSGGLKSEKRMLSAIAALNLGWKNQLYLDITGRNDWSSALVYANGTGNHSYFYPSVSGSWIITETFREQLPEWISFAKIRGSWAQVGNDTDPYYVNQAYGFSTIELPEGGNIYTNTLNTIMKAANLKPERKNAWEIGLDLRTFKNRLNLDITYYKENTKDQIMEIQTPWVSGISTKLINAGNIQNQGFEVALNTIPFQNEDWEWGLDFTWTKNTSKIVELHPDAADYISLAGQVNMYDYRIGAVAKVGGTYGMLMTDILPARDKQGRVLLNYSDTRRAVYERRSGVVEELGDMQPDFLGSMSTNLRWKDLSLHVGLDMRIGGMVAMYSNRYGSNAGWTESSLKYRDASRGGLTWTSQFAGGSQGITYDDGVILDGVFAPGTKATGIDGQVHDISGMSHQEAVDKGIIEPTHAGAYHVFRNSWAEGVVNDDWVHELNYIALRDISLSYRIPSNWAAKLGAKSMNLSLAARNVGYIYNSLPNNVHPESVRGNRAAEFRIRGYEPYIRNYTFTISAEF